MLQAFLRAFLLALAVMVLCAADGRIDASEATLLISVYVAYTVVIVRLERQAARQLVGRSAAQHGHEIGKGHGARAVRVNSINKLTGDCLGIVGNRHILNILPVKALLKKALQRHIK